MRKRQRKRSMRIKKSRQMRSVRRRSRGMRRARTSRSTRKRRRRRKRAASPRWRTRRTRRLMNASSRMGRATTIRLVLGQSRGSGLQLIKSLSTLRMILTRTRVRWGSMALLLPANLVASIVSRSSRTLALISQLRRSSHRTRTQATWSRSMTRPIKMITILRR